MAPLTAFRTTALAGRALSGALSGPSPRASTRPGALLLLPRSSTPSPSPLTSHLAPSTQRRLLHLTARLHAANPQAGGPASEDAAHAAKNVKEEVRAVKNSLASAIGGGAGSNDKGAEAGGATGVNEILSDAKSITGEMAKVVPKPALLWGAAGIIPYVSTAAASVWLARQTKMVATGEHFSILWIIPSSTC